MFKIGNTYTTQEGKEVKIVENNWHKSHPDYHCVKGDDNKWRYSRDSDMGRITGSNFDMSDPSNLVVPEEFKEEIRLRAHILQLYRALNQIKGTNQLDIASINYIETLLQSDKSYGGLENIANNAHEFVKNPREITARAYNCKVEDLIPLKDIKNGATQTRAEIYNWREGDCPKR